MGFSFLGINGEPFPIRLTDVTEVAAGSYHGLALRANNEVVGWGWNYVDGDWEGWEYRLFVPDNLEEVISVAAGSDHSLALQRNGRVVEWFGRSVVDTAWLSNVVAVAAGSNHSLALRRTAASCAGRQLLRADQCAARLEQRGGDCRWGTAQSRSPI